MIRPIEPRDAGAVAEIWNQIIRDTALTFNSQEKTEDDLIHLLIAKRDLGHGFFVAEEDGAVTGFATYGQFRAGPGYARSMEHSIILAPDARGRGLGRRLMGEIEAHARAGDAHSLIGGISSENADGLAFHAALGFEEVARVPEVGWKFDRWMDLVLVQKIL